MAFSVPSSDEVFTVPSSDGVPTVASSPQPVTVSSASSQEMAAAAYVVQGGFDIAVSETSVPVTVEQVDSSSMEQQRSLPSSSSSEDMELLEAQAALAEAKLKIQLAKNKKAKRSTNSSRSPAASQVPLSPEEPAPQPQLAVPTVLNNAIEQDRPAVLPISEDPWCFRMWTPKDARDHDRRDTELRPRDLPPREGRHAPELHGHDLHPREHPARDQAMAQPPVDIGAGVGSLHSPDSNASREMHAMRNRIAQLEAQLTVTPPSPKDSGFQTPREVPVVNNLIDLDTPPRPRVPKEEINFDDLRSRMMMPPVLPGPFEQNLVEVESPPGLNNFVLLNHGKSQKTKGRDAGPSPPLRMTHPPPHPRATPTRTTTNGSRR